MRAFRLHRLFHPTSHRCFNVALDHGFFHGRDPLSGAENLEQSVRILVEAAPDALQLTIGQAELLQNIPGKQKPALVLRTDVANVSGAAASRPLFSRILGNAVEQAIRLDAAGVVVSLFRIPGHPEVTDQCLANILKIKPDCDRWCLPLMIEPVVVRPDDQAGGYQIDGDFEKILPLIRQAIELGADIIQAHPPDDLSSFGKVIEIADRIPVLVRSDNRGQGQGQTHDQEILAQAEKLIQQGAAGIVHGGPHILQHPTPAGLTQALKAIVHEGAAAAHLSIC